MQIVSGVGTDGSGFQMTVAEYLTPQGNKVHKLGLAPDVEIPLEDGDNGEYDFADDQKDPQLKKALETMLYKMGQVK